MSQMIKKMTLLMQLEDGSSQLEPEAFDIAELLGNLMRKNAILFEEKHAQLTPAGRPAGFRARRRLPHRERPLQLPLQRAAPCAGRRWYRASSGGPVTNGCASRFTTTAPVSRPPICLIYGKAFYKVDKARTRAYGGTGIGLSVVAAIMRAHRMPCGVFNRQDGDRTGVEFYIELEQAGPPAESI